VPAPRVQAGTRPGLRERAGLETDRLYYQDPYLRDFTARVVARQIIQGHLAVALDRTAFYPTGGGQPHDTGTLAEVKVVDVIAAEVEDPLGTSSSEGPNAVSRGVGVGGLVWHVLDGDVPDGELAGAIDWSRRFDHMQQHTGQHILSQAFIRSCGAETVGFHLGSNMSTVDLNRTDLTPDAMGEAEAAANAVVDLALPVTTTVFDEDDLRGSAPSAEKQILLRRPPKAKGRIRVVQVQGYDWSACGGTHVANAAQVGLVKIVGTERRGPETRVSFLCGGRARSDYIRLQALAAGLAARFTVGQDELPAAVDRLVAEQRALRRELGDLEGHWVESTAALLWAGARPLGRGRRLVTSIFDCPVERVKRLIQVLRTNAGAVVLLGVLREGERPQLVFTRADDVSLNVGELMRVATAAGDGRGGGRPDWAQGGVPTAESLTAALAAAETAASGFSEILPKGDSHA
jgi:alanyl-tRNA synthetase